MQDKWGEESCQPSGTRFKGSNAVCESVKPGQSWRRGEGD